VSVAHIGLEDKTNWEVCVGPGERVGTGRREPTGQITLGGVGTQSEQHEEEEEEEEGRKNKEQEEEEEGKSARERHLVIIGKMYTQRRQISRLDIPFYLHD
jgi:hypothetical protein